MSKKQITTRDPHVALREATSARIALGRAGGGLPTAEWLDFRFSHARAQDAVHREFDESALVEQLRVGGVEVVSVETAAPDRDTYLRRPDLGRRLTAESAQRLEEVAAAAGPVDLAIILSDGLSAPAIERHGVVMTERLLTKVGAAGWSVAPVVVARLGRVALQDDIGQRLGARLSLILIGERPGLGSPDSLGAYLTHDPRPGRTDAERNCVSNIRPEGLDYDTAAETIFHLLLRARELGVSGVRLKDERLLTQRRRKRIES